MIFRETILKGAYIIEPERREDSRGFFARVWCRKEFLAEGLNGQLAQSNISYTKAKGTLRGMHYQAAPFGEIKLVRCTMGAIYDVIIDLRPESPTYLQWIAEELTAENRKILYVPKKFAHGFQSLVDDTEVFYQISEFYVPDAERGVRYDDPIFKITWPLDVVLISDKDRGWPDYKP